MGFADYRSGHPNSPHNYVIDTIMALHYTLHSVHRKRTNQENETHIVKNQSKRNESKQRAFCHLHAFEQPPSNLSNKTHIKQLIPIFINQNKFISRIHLDKLSTKENTYQPKTDPS